MLYRTGWQLMSATVMKCWHSGDETVKVLSEEGEGAFPAGEFMCRGHIRGALCCCDENV